MLQNRWRKPGGVMARPVMFKTREAGRISASDFDRNYPQYSPHYVITVKHKSSGEWVPVRSAGLARLLAHRLGSYLTLALSVCQNAWVAGRACHQKGNHEERNRDRERVRVRTSGRALWAGKCG